MRQKSASRKLKGSNNQKKSYSKLARQKHKLAQKRDGYNWQVASTTVKKADAVAREDLNIKNMVKRAKPKHDGFGGYQKNGATRKTALNKVILDCGWGDLFSKIAWLALKAAKPVIAVNPKHSSSVCPNCGHIDKRNRDGEKFVCRECHYTDHADLKASREIAKRVGLVFPKNNKTLRAFALEVTPVKPVNQEASTVSRVESRNHAYGVKATQLSLFDLSEYTVPNSRKTKKYGRTS